MTNEMRTTMDGEGIEYFQYYKAPQYFTAFGIFNTWEDIISYYGIYIYRWRNFGDFDFFGSGRLQSHL